MPDDKPYTRVGAAGPCFRVEYGVIASKHFDDMGCWHFDIEAWEPAYWPFAIKLTEQAHISGYDGAFLHDVDACGREQPTGIWDYWYTARAEDYAGASIMCIGRSTATTTYTQVMTRDMPVIGASPIW